MRLLLLTAAMVVSGCAGIGGGAGLSPESIDALAKDPASNCVVVNTPYGGLLVARGTPGAKVTLAGGSCSIESVPAPAKTP